MDGWTLFNSPRVTPSPEARNPTTREKLTPFSAEWKASVAMCAHSLPEHPDPLGVGYRPQAFPNVADPGGRGVLQLVLPLLARQRRRTDKRFLSPRPSSPNRPQLPERGLQLEPWRERKARHRHSRG